VTRTLAPETVERLLAVNRDFYAAVNVPFDATRSNIAPGMSLAVQRLFPEVAHSAAPLRVLDAGCGNGRFGWALEKSTIATDYLGIDDDAGLLQRAVEQSASLVSVQARFQRVNLAEADLSTFGEFDLVVCLAVLHHFPGRQLRGALLQRLASALAADGRLLISTWQFLDDPRLRERTQPWEAVGLSTKDVEPGDALLPWDQGTHALRYAHHIDEEEVADLASGAQLKVIDLFYADGKSGRLNLYAILAHK
jgi:2-polyprenyl-3-methyl-5-hydroxy-6-metoxy-1,4-benzoquinol methylase